MSGTSPLGLELQCYSPHMRRSLWTDLRASVREPDFWWSSAWMTFVSKYRRSYLGLFWVFVPPVIYIFAIGGFIGTLMGASAREVFAHVAVGFIIFRAFSGIAIAASNVLVASSAFILDGRTRLTDYILRILSIEGLYILVASPLVLLSMYIDGSLSMVGLASLLLSMPIIVLNLFFLAVFAAMVGVRFPDLSDVLSSVFMFAFLITPIVWFPHQAVEGSFHWWSMQLNPLYHFIEICRSPLLGQPMDPNSVLVVLGLTVIGVVVAWFAYRLFAARAPQWL